MITDCSCKIFKILGARCLPIVALFVVMAILAPQAAVAQPFFHGIAVAKQCTTPRLVGQTTSCLIIAQNTIDGAGDTLTVQGMWDIVQASPADVRVPAMGNLPIVATAGGAICAAGPAFPCNLPPGASVTVASNTYVIDGDDPNPLPDQGQILWNDNCDGTPDGACNGQNNTANAPAQTAIIECVTAEDCGSDPGVCADNACVDNECVVQFASATTECRAASGACDVAESCPGDSAECPADGFATATTECRAASGVCDVAESCPGDSAVCPEDGFATATTECRAASGECDAAESCPGTGPDCPIDEFQPSTTICNPGNPDVCDPAESCPGDSALCPPDDPGVGCVEATCRTVGYWGTHAGTEKDGSVNITQLTIALGGGSLDVCGETLTNTDVENGSSALEGICDSGGGRTQLARQLIAMSLNCINSEGPADCLGVTQFETVFTACNAECAADANQDAINACVGMVDCLNNGGQISMGSGGEFLCQTGTCSDNGADCSSGNKSNCADPALATCVPFESTCHDNPLLFPDTPAGSAKACNDARKSDCDIFNASCDVP